MNIRFWKTSKNICTNEKDVLLSKKNRTHLLPYGIHKDDIVPRWNPTGQYFDQIQTQLANNIEPVLNMD